MNRDSAAGWDAIAIHPDDDVAVALKDLAPGAARARIGDGVIAATLGERVPLGHKFALRAIAAGEAVRKYGEAIGRATCDIAAGAHVHIHNLRSDRARRTS
jgi:altronate dehydratase